MKRLAIFTAKNTNAMLYTILLYLHIFAGFTALLSGGISFSAPKGRTTHKRTGLVYVIAMLLVGISALIMCLLKFNPFLFSVGLFSTYMTLTGYRSLQYPTKLASGQLRPDWIIWGITLVLATGFSGYQPQQHGFSLSGMQPVLIIFMSILFALLLRDWQLFRNSASFTKQKLLLRHISRMGGAYISTFTAFLVVNVETEPVFLAWLLPTTIGSPVIAYFIIKYKPKQKTVRQSA